MTDSHKTEIVRVEPASLASRALHPLIAELRDGRIDPATIGKMMDLQERHEANEAKKAFTRAMAGLKSSLPKVIARDTTVDYGKGESATHYTHASLAAVVDAVVEHLTAHGFTHSWPVATRDNRVFVTCRLTHTEGHREECTLDAPPDAKGGKGGAQAIASTITLLQRYSLLALLGIATRDMKEPTGEPAAPPPPKVDPARNLAAVGELRKRGVDLEAVVAKVGRPVEQWTTADLDVVRGMLPRKPKENADGSVDVDPPKG